MMNNNEVEKSLDKTFEFLTSYRSEKPKAQKLKTEFGPGDIVLFKIDEITFEEDAPRQEALENVFASLRISGINFVYLILGSGKGVNFYFGLSKDLNEDSEVNIKNIGESILKPSLEGNFRGSRVSSLEEQEKSLQEKRIIVEKLLSPSSERCYATLDGVPGLNKDDSKKNFQGVDRLVDVMLGDEFGFMVIAHPMSREEDISDIERSLDSIYDEVGFIAKQSVQYGTNQSIQSGESRTIGKSTSDTEGYSNTEGTSCGRNEGTSYGEQDTDGENTGTEKSTGSASSNSSTSSGKSHSKATNAGNSQGTNSGETKSKSINVSYSVSNNDSYAHNEGTQKGDSKTVSVDRIHKNMQEWMKYFDEVILPRLDYGHGKGIFIVSSLLWADNEKVLDKLANTAAALFAGEKGNRVPFNITKLEKGNYHLVALRNFQQPLRDELLSKNTDEWKREILWSHAYLLSDKQVGTNSSRFYLGNWMSVKELAIMAGIPQKEVVGLRLKEEVEFGLNIQNTQKENDREINLGNLVVSGNIKEIPVNILSSDLDRHVFVTGVTGAGKTTTCQNLLIDSGLQFLIIEPAKTEYRILLEKFPDLEIFTIGSNIAPLRLNPFQFFRGESITSRVDMIKASIEAAFDMEAAIPQIIEQTIYASYERKGWNINTNKNMRFDDPWAPDVDSFPTMNDILNSVHDAVDANEFGNDRLRNEYIGSIKARLQGLTLGSKGMMLNCSRSIDFDELLDKRVVLELEELRDGGEKSLVIGFVMINLLEAIRRRFEKNNNKKYLHLTLIEEAHRLLSKPQPGDSNKQHGVDTFTDMLAEIRKYGESLIIADQIPNKLTSEVLKNTNTKIVHRLFAQDDKDAIGNTMSLTEEQRNFLSNLDVGRAVVFNGNWTKAVQVQIKKSSDTSKGGEEEHIIDKAGLKKRNLQFYINHWDKGIIDGSGMFNRQPTPEEMELLIGLGNNIDYKNALFELKEGKNKTRVKPLMELFEKLPNQEVLLDILVKNYSGELSKKIKNPIVKEDLQAALAAYEKGESCPTSFSQRLK